MQMQRQLLKEFVYVVPIILCLGGCGGQKRKEGVAEIQKVQVAVHEMSVVVGVGANQAEFTRRLTDVLLKIGDLQESGKLAASKFPKSDQQAVAEVYQHLSLALASYNESKDFFGDHHKEQLDPWDGDFTFGQNKYDALEARFPGIQKSYIELSVGDFKGNYWKGNMLQALWKYAGDEEQTAKTLIDQLNQK
jgi:hypothetical protein